jgi:hypothetical protein
MEANGRGFAKMALFYENASNSHNFCDSGFFAHAEFAIFAKPLLAFRAKFHCFGEAEFTNETVLPRFVFTELCYFISTFPF